MNNKLAVRGRSLSGDSANMLLNVVFEDYE